MERAQITPVPLSVFFEAVPVEELTIEGALLIRESASGGYSAVTATDSPIDLSVDPVDPAGHRSGDFPVGAIVANDPSIRHAVTALTSIGTIGEFFRATDALRSTDTLLLRARAPRVLGETQVRTYEVSR